MGVSGRAKPGGCPEVGGCGMGRRWPELRPRSLGDAVVGPPEPRWN